VAAAAGLAMPAAGAADQPATTGSPDDLAALLKTLQDPAAREQLVAQLKALQETRGKTTADMPQDAISVVVRAVSDRVAQVTDAMASSTEALGQVPEVFGWARESLASDYTRSFYLTVLQSFGLAFGLGGLAGLLAHHLPSRYRGRLAVPPKADFSRTLLLVAARLALEMVPPLLFMIVTVLALRWVAVSGLAQLLARQLLLAIALGRFSAAIRRALLYPLEGEGRPLPIGEVDARETNRWWMMIGSVSIYGYFALQMAALLGLPGQVYGVLLHLLFLITTCMLIALVWRIKDPVAIQCARAGEAWGGGPVGRFVPWGWLARNGHIVVGSWIALHYAIWALHVPGGFHFLLRATLATIGILMLARLLLILIEQRGPGAGPVAEPGEEGLPPEALPPEQQRRLRLVNAGRSAVGLLTLVALLEAWNVDVLDWLRGSTGRGWVLLAVRVLVVVLVSLVAWKALNHWVSRYLTAVDGQGNLIYSRRTRTLANIGRNLMLVLLVIIAALFILTEAGIDTAPLLAGAGVVGIAVGFGSQRLIQDIITGLFILLGDTIRVGDVVDLGGKAGAVEGMSMRTVTLRDYGGAVHTIPYSTIDTVTNMTKDYSFAVINVGVAYREDVDQVMQVLRELDMQLRREWPYRRLILEPLDIAGVDEIGASSISIMGRIKVRPGEQWKVRRELTRRIKRRFDELGIQLPFPHQTVYFGQDKQGQAPPLFIERLRHDLMQAEPAPPAKAVGET
jgi:small conductance mechanosensitive channel